MPKAGGSFHAAFRFGLFPNRGLVWKASSAGVVMLLRSIVVAVVGVAAALSGCTTDEKGLNCGLLDVYTNSAGEAYCPDPAAEDDCVLLRDTMVESFVRCGLDEATATEAAEDSFDCTTAVATTTSFDDCVAKLDDADLCLVTAADLPESCYGAVLMHG
jgi:hypothetical protein